jgi:hypothetical protein
MYLPSCCLATDRWVCVWSSLRKRPTAPCNGHVYNLLGKAYLDYSIVSTSHKRTLGRSSGRIIIEKWRWNLQENKPIPLLLSHHMSHICCPVTAVLYRTFEKSVCIWALFNLVKITAAYNTQGVFSQDMRVVSTTNCGAQSPPPANALNNDRGRNSRRVTFRHIPYMYGTTTLSRTVKNLSNLWGVTSTYQLQRVFFLACLLCIVTVWYWTCRHLYPSDRQWQC